MAAPLHTANVATKILDYVRRLAEPPQSEPKTHALRIRIALLPTVLQWPFQSRQPLDFMVHVTNGTPNKVKEGLERRFKAHFKNLPSYLQFTEYPAAANKRRVPVRLFCAQLYGCEPTRMPLLDPAGQNVVQPVCPSDLVVFQISCLAQADESTWPDLVADKQEFLIAKESFGRLKLTDRQLKQVQDFLPDLDVYGWPMIAWRLNLGLPRPPAIPTAKGRLRQ